MSWHRGRSFLPLRHSRGSGGLKLGPGPMLWADIGLWREIGLGATRVVPLWCDGGSSLTTDSHFILIIFLSDGWKGVGKIIRDMSRLFFFYFAPHIQGEEIWIESTTGFEQQSRLEDWKTLELYFIVNFHWDLPFKLNLGTSYRCSKLNIPWQN